MIKLKIVRLEAKKYKFKKILAITDRYKILELQRRINDADLLARQNDYSGAIGELEKIKLDFKQDGSLKDHSGRINSKLADIKKLEEEFRKTSEIKGIILDLGTKFTRLQILEIIEKTGINDEKLTVQAIIEMINHQEIFAEYFQSSKTVVFNQQQNLEDIDELLEKYKDWEEKKVGKKKE